MAHGFDYAPNNGWSNLGQGAPEVGHIDGAPDRPTTIEMSLDSLEYAPTTGVKGQRNLFVLFLIYMLIACLALRH